MIMPTLRSPSLGSFAVGCLCQCCQERFLALEGTSLLPSAMESAQPAPTPLFESHWARGEPRARSPWCCQALPRRCLILPTCPSPARCQCLSRLWFGRYCSTVYASGASEASLEITGRDNATTEMLIGCISHTLSLPT